VGGRVPPHRGAHPLNPPGDPTGRHPPGVVPDPARGGHVDVRAYAELNDFLPVEVRGTTARRPFRPHQTVKDVIEAAGIPHTEVDLVLVEGEPVPLDHRPATGARIAVYPVFERFDVGPVTRVRPTPLRVVRLVADVHLGRLARLLRLLGLDVRWENDVDDAALESISEAEHRVVLTRDRGLLKRRRVTHGLYVRSQEPVEQAVEVVRRLHLSGALAPFTRCLRCGGELAPVDKAEVIDRLEPLTRRHHHAFQRCTGCGNVYWRGSHHPRLAAVVGRIRARV
jgi:uncharacterized protein with PIN domain/sulfur carrier protein ThiS